jgi:hypothetical protein
VWQQPKAKDGIKRAIGVGKGSKIPHIEPAGALIDELLEPRPTGGIAPYYGDSISSIYQGRRYLRVPSPYVQH